MSAREVNVTKGRQGFQETTKTEPTDTDLSSEPEFSALDSMNTEDRHVLHNVLLAQVDDNHAGGTMNWDADDHFAAKKMFDTLEHRPDEIGLTPVQTRAALLSLMYVVHETDHSDLSDDEWAAAEHMLNHLSPEFGR
jgi:hypothetical protein